MVVIVAHATLSRAEDFLLSSAVEQSFLVKQNLKNVQVTTVKWNIQIRKYKRTEDKNYLYKYSSI